MGTRLRGITTQVKRILENDPRTRNSDDVLYAKIVKDLGYTDFPVYAFLEYRASFDIPSYESVSRCRRKLQELYPELAADPNVEAARELEEERFREYAKSV